MSNLAGKTLFITGASRGIGLAIALRAARDGAHIVIAAKSGVPNPKLPGTIHTAAAEVMAARQLNYFAARRKDAGARCDMQAGMAKLLGARVAWACADAAVQIHGGNGFALEYPVSRLLCDARVLSIFEGAA